MDINSLELERFTGYGSKVSRRISINKSYGFSVPRPFLKENNLLDSDFTELFFDKIAQVIGILFKKGEGDGGFKLNYYGTKEDPKGVSFVAKSFFTTYNIDVNKVAGQYSPQKKTVEGIGDVYLMQLKEKDPIQNP